MAKKDEKTPQPDGQPAATTETASLLDTIIKDGKMARDESQLPSPSAKTR